MKILRKASFFLLFLFLFLIIAGAGTLFLSFSGMLIPGLILMIVLLGMIVKDTYCWIKRKRPWTTNVKRISFSMIGIAALFFALAVSSSFDSQYKLLTDSPLSPKLKINLLSHTLVGHAIWDEDYESVKEDEIEFYYPVEEENYQLLIDRALTEIEEHETIFEEYFGSPKKMDLRIKFSNLLDKDQRIEGGYYVGEEIQIYLLSPIEQMGWERWDSIVVHEYSHYLFDMTVREKGLTSSNFPQWFDEGIATHLADDKRFRNEGKEKEWVPFKDLAFYEWWQEKRIDERYDPYFQAQMFIDRLVELKGPEVILDIIDKTAQHHSFESAFLLVVGEKTEDFGDKVIQEIEQMKAEK